LKIVTGSAGGIGEAICEALDGEVLGIDKHNCDLTHWRDVRIMLHDVKHCSLLVNCAGVSLPGKYGDLDYWDKTFAVNVTAPYWLASCLKDRMKGGQIINITSLNAHMGFPDNPAYVASKSALLGLTRAMAVDFAPDIRVNAICPGYILTPMTEASFKDDALRAERTNRTLLGTYGRPEDIAGAVLYLEKTKYVTGAEITVDGGWRAKGL
jgi:meso-butanediol dehydrogenase / (S,S)-butanediol dehydrogenase / diacetyl reductase